jgi:sugar/nucleoside kinase (ribokinase family)
VAELLVIGALALDRPIRLNGPFAAGARLQGVTLDGALGGRLGGGGGNAGVALARAGHRVSVSAFLAGDADGESVLAAAATAGLDTRLVSRRPGISRTTLILIDANGERVVLGLDPLLLSLTDLPHLPAPSGSDRFDGIYVRAPYPGAAAWCEANPGLVVAHWPAGEFRGPCDVLVGSVDDCDAAMLADPFTVARARFGDRLRWVVLTRGAEGVRAWSADQVLDVTSEPVPVVDSTGAGDVFTAGLLDALTAGADMAAALAHACRWGAITVGLDSSAPLTGDFPAFRPVSP